MSKQKNKRHVNIEIYDEDGELYESVGGRMDGVELMDTLRDIVRNDGIPVVRLVDHEKTGTQTADKLKEACRIQEQPMSVEWQIGQMHFSACGNPEDVLDAMQELLDFAKDIPVGAIAKGN